ncbi:hypothetical protein HOD05_00880 [Candidatus Woesearchaeota archaeon]|jgi:hypothetical protein|nr:hypothetical protein [Candidatus Woesearchaeota archaeon]MBT4150961.1 hypothetical protein [Candidatus Woesearchaeota archaeon]MBT4247334.1 hypothetical protein [Candidatus Woesearchaeota archaeon]MBT4433751.1 hypothetical protein [Candidatus Woesearchaeota archaeon]MBT7332501.1 hypothetical protein [Candidatus Woesearchaeota archaeon]
MKFYVSAKWHLKDHVSAMNEYLRSQGHESTADWTVRAYARGYGGENAQMSDELSEEEIHAILESDLFIHLSDMGGKGKYIDLGIALAGHKLQGKPDIYILGKDANESQFYFNRSVKGRIQTEDVVECLDEILKNYS